MMNLNKINYLSIFDFYKEYYIMKIIFKGYLFKLIIYEDF